MVGEEIKFPQACLTINGVASSSGARVKFIEGDIQALKIVYADTHGLEFYCEAEEVDKQSPFSQWN